MVERTACDYKLKDKPCNIHRTIRWFLSLIETSTVRYDNISFFLLLLIISTAFPHSSNGNFPSFLLEERANFIHHRQQ